MEHELADDDLELEDDLPPPPPPGDNPPQDDQQDEQPDEQEVDEGADDEVDAAPPGQESRQQEPSRGESRQARQQQTIIEQRERIAALERRLDTYLQNGGGSQPRQPVGETPEQRAQRRAVMSEGEILREDMREQAQQFNVQLATVQQATLDANDRASFDAQCAVDRDFAKWKPKVEARLAEMRAQGFNSSRENIMKYLVGEAVLAKRDSEGRRQRRDADTRVRRQTTRPTNSGSDASANRSRQTQSLERRLENVQI